ncbi:hypothetical protein D3C85_1831460 [compost metagenome]
MITTVALANVVLLSSVTVIPESIATGVETMLSPATNEAEPASVDNSGPDAAKVVGAM